MDYTSIIWGLGFLQGYLENDSFRDFLKSRGVSESQLSALKKDLSSLRLQIQAGEIESPTPKPPAR